MGTAYADKVAEKDHNYLTINYGQAYEFRFKTPDSFVASEQGDVSVVVSGFYLPFGTID
jgi:hypothetical protein